MKRGKLSFGSIFSKTVEDYKRNFKSIFLFLLVFIGIFSLLSFVISSIIIMNDKTIQDFVINSHLENYQFDIIDFPWSYMIITWVLGIISIVLSIFVSGGLVSISVRKETFTYRELVKAARASFGTYILFIIVSGIFLFGLFLLLIIPGIIFMVYWSVSSYVLFYEKKGILESLKRSLELVKGNWWRMFGYLILVFLLLVVISIGISIVVQPTQFVQMMSLFYQQPISPEFFLLNSFLAVISQFIGTVIYVPFMMLFFKNVYVRLRR